MQIYIRSSDLRTPRIHLVLYKKEKVSFEIVLHHTNASSQQKIRNSKHKRGVDQNERQCPGRIPSFRRRHSKHYNEHSVGKNKKNKEQDK